ncbi:MAG TPA: HXXEE domain-containing protein [Vicinamibacterales bacterium]|nr:HXXEE domain-containing protein [Vicinamibacterales bacterium]
MLKRGSDLAQSAAVDGPVRHMRAWLLLVGALAVHVIDEASTGFLDFYNPLVLSIRTEMPLFPMPTFTFGNWLGGLALLVLALAALAPVVRQGGPAIRLASWVLAVVMLMNGVGHLAGSVYFQRWLPGATSAPLLIACSVFLMRATRERSRGDSAGVRHVV